MKRLVPIKVDWFYIILIVTYRMKRGVIVSFLVVVLSSACHAAKLRKYTSKTILKISYCWKVFVILNETFFIIG